MDFNDRLDSLALDYLHQALQFTPTEADYAGWVGAQPEAARAGLSRTGPAACWATGPLSLQAWVLTRRGFSLNAFMVQRLSEADYLRWGKRFAATAGARPY